MYLKKYNVYIAVFPQTNDFCLMGKHHCVFLKKTGQTAIVIPISSIRDNKIKNGEIRYKNIYKLKVSQITSIDIDKIILSKKGCLNNVIKKKIKDFF
jgi:hypothetical protein